MESVSTRLANETHQYVRETADERDVSQAEVLRELIEKGVEYDDLKRENQRLQNRVRKLIDTREEHDELVEYVEEERLDRQRERDRREQRRQTNVFRRAWWWLAGEPAEDESAD